MASCGPELPTDAWRHSCIHPETVAYSCGRLARPGGPNEHDHDPEEVARCRRLAEAAGRVCRGVEVFASEARSALAPFFVTANRHAPAPGRLAPRVIRAAFGGVIYPRARCTVTPLKEGTRGWLEIADGEDGELRLPRGAEGTFTPGKLEAMRAATRDRW
jgi:hypothetical protein